MENDLGTKAGIGFFKFFLALKKKGKPKRPGEQIPGPFFFSAPMVLALDGLLPSRASLHPHIGHMKLSDNLKKTKRTLKIKLKQVNLI